MATAKDIEFVDFIFQKTEDRKVNWEATANEDEFVASFKGKYKLLIQRIKGPMGNDFRLTLVDDSERDLLVVPDDEYPRVRVLYNLALRNSLQVDAAIDEIMESVDDIPF